MDMFLAIWHLLLRSFLGIPGALGSTFLGVVFPIFVALIGEAIGVKLWGWKEMIQNWKRATGIGFAALGIGYALLFFWLIVDNVYQDHIKLEAQVRQSESGPEFKLDIQNGVTAILGEPNNRNVSLVIVSGAVINVHGPETGTTNWQMWIDHLDNGAVLHARMVPNLPSRTDLRVMYPAWNGQLAIEPSEFWPEKTSEPIRPGQISMGWIWGEFPITLADLDRQEKSAILHVQFDDIVSGKTHQASLVLNTASRNLPWFSKFPGGTEDKKENK